MSRASDDERELLGLWLSRVMFNMFVGWAPETRSFEQFLADSRSDSNQRTRRWRWLANPRVREYRRMTKRGWTLHYDGQGNPFWL